MTGDDENGTLIRRELEARGVDAEHACVHHAKNAFAVILVDERRGERVVLWQRDAALTLLPREIDPSVVAQSRLVHVDDVDEDAAICAASIGRSAGIPVTSDIERVTERTEEPVAAVTIPIFAEHVIEQLTGEGDFERGLRKIRASRRTRPRTVRLKPDTCTGLRHVVRNTWRSGRYAAGGAIGSIMRRDCRSRWSIQQAPATCSGARSLPRCCAVILPPTFSGLPTPPRR